MRAWPDSDVHVYQIVNLFKKVNSTTGGNRNTAISIEFLPSSVCTFFYDLIVALDDFDVKVEEGMNWEGRLGGLRGRR